MNPSIKNNVKNNYSYKFSPFAVVCCFICKLCKDLSQELLILLLNERKSKMINTHHLFFAPIIHQVSFVYNELF